MSRRTAHVFEEKWRSDDVKLLEQVDFSSLLLSDRVLCGLKRAGYKNPSPIQLEAIPVGRFGKDLIVQAKSGTGKTLVFTIIALEVLLDVPNSQIMILAPTREIAFQISGVLNAVGSKFKNFKCSTFIGGFAIADDVEKAKNCQIIVGTPGRVKQLIKIKVLKTRSIRLLVLDEADQLFDPSFLSEIDTIFLALPKEKQVIATSATYPKVLKELTDRYFRRPFLARLNTNELALLGIIHYTLTVVASQIAVLAYRKKLDALEKVLNNVEFSQCLVFCNLVLRVETLCSDIRKWGFTTIYISSAKEQSARLKAIECLKRFKCKVLVSSDVTSRGIDAENVDLIINFDMPKFTKIYLHRVGRAGRYGSKGAAITFITDDETTAFETFQHEGHFRAYVLPDPVPANLVNLRPDSSSIVEKIDVSSVISENESPLDKKIPPNSCNVEQSLEETDITLIPEIKDLNLPPFDALGIELCDSVTVGEELFCNSIDDETVVKDDKLIDGEILASESIDENHVIVDVSKSEAMLNTTLPFVVSEDLENMFQKGIGRILFSTSNESMSLETGEIFHETLEQIAGNTDNDSKDVSVYFESKMNVFQKNDSNQCEGNESVSSFDEISNKQCMSSEIASSGLYGVNPPKSDSNLGENDIAIVLTSDSTSEKNSNEMLCGVFNDTKTLSQDTELEKKCLEVLKNPDDITLSVAKFINSYEKGRKDRVLESVDATDIKTLDTTFPVTKNSISAFRESLSESYHRVFSIFKDEFVRINGSEQLELILKDNAIATQETNKLTKNGNDPFVGSKCVSDSTTQSDSSTDCTSDSNEEYGKAGIECHASVKPVAAISTSDTESSSETHASVKPVAAISTSDTESSSEDESLIKFQLLEKAFEKMVRNAAPQKQSFNPSTERLKKALHDIKDELNTETCNKCTSNESLESLSKQQMNSEPLKEEMFYAFDSDSIERKPHMKLHMDTEKIISPIFKKNPLCIITSFGSENSCSPINSFHQSFFECPHKTDSRPQNSTVPVHNYYQKSGARPQNTTASTLNSHQKTDASPNNHTVSALNDHPKRGVTPQNATVPPFNLRQKKDAIPKNFTFLAQNDEQRSGAKPKNAKVPILNCHHESVTRPQKATVQNLNCSQRSGSRSSSICPNFHKNNGINLRNMSQISSKSKGLNSQSQFFNKIHDLRFQCNDSSNFPLPSCNSLGPSNHRCHLLSSDLSCRSQSCQSFYEIFYQQWSCIQQAVYFQ